MTATGASYSLPLRPAKGGSSNRYPPLGIGRATGLHAPKLPSALPAHRLSWWLCPSCCLRWKEVSPLNSRLEARTALIRRQFPFLGASASAKILLIWEITVQPFNLAAQLS